MPKKVIVSAIGELTEDSRITGDRVRFRIYYEGRISPRPTRAAEVTITDAVDKKLSHVRPLNRGKYDSLKRTITWTVSRRLSSRTAHVDFEAVVDAPGIITNQASVRAGRQRPVKTNAVTINAVAPPRVGWIPFQKGAKEGEPPCIYMKDETTMGTTVRFDIPGVFVHKEVVNGVAYHHVTIPGRGWTADLGKPEMPVTGEAIEVPFGVNFTPEVVKEEKVRLKGYNIYPVQPPPIAAPVAFTLDKPTYLAATDYPPQLAVAAGGDIGIIRGHLVLFLKLNPLQYNPVTKVITAHPLLEVRLNYGHPAQLRGVSQRLASPAFEELLESTVLNYKQPERFATAGGGASGSKEGGCDYLIITDDNLYNAGDTNNGIVRLRDWKTRKGYRTKVVKVGSLQGGNTEAAIETYIQNAYNTWEPAPSYVLLVGDSDKLVPHAGHAHPNQLDSSGNPWQPPIFNDLKYATVDGTDDFPDIYIGRLPAESSRQLTDMVNKILAYEQNPPATPLHSAYYTDASLISLCQDTYSPYKTVPNGREYFPWIATVENIRQYLLGQNYNVERIYATNSGFPPAGPGTPSPTQFQNGNALPNDLLAPNYGWDGDAADISAAFNAGRFLVSYLAHGAPDAWSQPDFSIANINALNQNDLTPVVFSITCQTGWFDNEVDDDTLGGRAAGSDSFAEAMLRRPRAGAVAVVAQTRVSYVYWNSFIELGMFKAIWPDYAPAPPWTSGASGEPAVPDVTPPRLLRLGQILHFGKMYLAKAYGPDVHRTAEFEMGHLFGDPEMPVWVRAPLKLKVVHPKGIGATGRQEFMVRVTDQTSGTPVLNATIALTRQNVLLQMRQTGAEGTARFDMNAVGAGDVDITVTSLGYLPYMGAIVVKSGGAQLDPFNPTDGPDGQAIHTGGLDFGPGEKVDLYFGDQLLKTVNAGTGGDFGQGGSPVDVTPPAGFAHGLINVWAHGQTSDRYAIRVYQLRDKNPIDLWTYDQWDSGTWSVHPGDNPTWDSPDIQLYDKNGAAVASDNLVVQEKYTVKIKVRNKEAFVANQAKVTFRWRNYGIDGPWDLFTPTPTATVNVPANPPGEVLAKNSFTPPTTGHLCIKATIEHLEDTTPGNNEGQENLHVDYSNSPVQVCFLVWNMTREPAPMHLEVRQLVEPGHENTERLWATWVKHPEPQILTPGGRGEACVIVDPDPADVKPGVEANFAVTGFIGKKMVGGVNLKITKK